MIDIELPLEKRSRSYRFFEMVPALLSYGMFVIVIVLSFINPFVASIYILLVIITMFIKALGIAGHSIVGYRQLKHARSVNWAARLADLEHPAAAYASQRTTQSDENNVHNENLRLIAADPSAFPRPSELYHLVIVAAYNEPYDVIKSTMDCLSKISKNTSSKIILCMAYEERGGQEIHDTVMRLEKEYRNSFHKFISVMHPADLPDEIVGKGANITYAAQHVEKLFDKENIEYKDVIITTLDCDNKPYESYFDYLMYEFIVHENRKHLSFQPISLYFSNIWDAPAPMRVIAIGNTFWTIVSSVRPHTLRNFAAHSQPMEALREMNYWSKRSIVEDGHQYWRSYFFFNGDYYVVPIYVPVYQDAVLAKDFKSTIVAQFKQLRRWGYGASDIPYVATRLFTRQRNVPFFAGLGRFLRLLDSHISLATIAVVIAIGGWIPLLINPDAQFSIIAHNLPELVGRIQFFAMTGLFTTIILTLKLLPPRPSRYSRIKNVAMLLQWVLMPVTSIAFSAVASLNAQTHLLLGKYLTKFDVTEKTNRN